MQDFADMAEAHAWTLRRLREMAGRLTEQAYLRASEASAAEPEDAQRWMLVFDRMARGLRLTMALEARLARERRWDADELAREASGERHAPRWRRPETRPADAEPVERDREADDDGLPSNASLPQRIARLHAILEAAGEPDPPVRLHKSEQLALDLQRARRAELAGRDVAPDEPWDVLSRDNREGWRGSG